MAGTVVLPVAGTLGGGVAGGIAGTAEGATLGLAAANAASATADLGVAVVNSGWAKKVWSWIRAAGIGGAIAGGEGKPEGSEHMGSGTVDPPAVIAPVKPPARPKEDGEKKDQ